MTQQSEVPKRITVEPGLWKRTTGLGTWFGISFTEPDGKRVRRLTGHTTKEAARAELGSIRATIRNGTYQPGGNGNTPPASNGMTVGDLCERFMETHGRDITPATAVRYQLSVAPIKAHLGERLVSSLTKDDVARFKTNRINDIGPVTRRTIKKATCNRDLFLLKTMLSSVGLNLLGEDGKPVKPYKENGERLRGLALKSEQAHALLAEMRPQLRLICMVSLYTGMRLDEIFRMTWENINTKAHTIRIDFGKTENAKRTLLLPPPLWAELNALPQPHAGLVFHGKDGGKVKSVYKGFCNARERAGIGEWREAKDGSRKQWPVFHDLRRTAGTNAHQAGASIVAVMKFLGHADVQTTQIYLNIEDEDILRVGELTGF